MTREKEKGNAQNIVKGFKIIAVGIGIVLVILLTYLIQSFLVNYYNEAVIEDEAMQKKCIENGYEKLTWQEFEGKEGFKCKKIITYSDGSKGIKISEGIYNLN